MGGVARRRGQSEHRAGPPVLSARARCQTAEGGAAENLAAVSAMIAWLSELWGGGTAAIEPATLRDAPALAKLHGASFHPGWGGGEFGGLLPERNTLGHGLRLGG